MDFLWYIYFFHDGSLDSIRHTAHQLNVHMTSSMLSAKDNKENIHLDKENCIRGELVIRNIKSITINKQPFLNKLRMFHEDAEILDFYLTGNGVELGISWDGIGVKPNEDCFTSILIESDNIFWEDDLNQVQLNLNGLRSGKYRQKLT